MATAGLGQRLELMFAAVGIALASVAVIARPVAARLSAGQNWSPFVLVAGLLLVGLVADDDGLFAAAGQLLARTLRNGLVLFIGATMMIGVVTATLNLDTSVAFLTPVLIYTARSSDIDEAGLMYGCLLLSNAGSLFLPGSNLTNLIIFGHLHLTGGQFLSRVWLPALSALLVTAIVIGILQRHSLRFTAHVVSELRKKPVLGVGLIAVAAATLIVLLLADPALPVAAVGVVAVSIRLGQRRTQLADVHGILGVPVLAGLFGLTVALGTLARIWSGPSDLLGHLGTWSTAAAAAGATILVNNLPAAALLGARTPPHPFALLIGLNLGPNLFVTGSLAWILWLKAARKTGATPSIGRASRIGAIAVPLSIAAAVGALSLTGAR